ncbi:hypothetical protein [Nonomuraea soli]|uniref:Uncharacterized protein n=1 Tax=Nonomuraea soli TaxID=1032476 RepID=A0A7W0HVT3_9ACTN|nr:hypothetical protein [Nonomuraea soli]MBA2897397.1 hypothetical protein [Nonomuraea soli]
MTSSRDRILGRPAPTAVYKLRVADTAAAAQALTDAQSELGILLVSGEGDEATLERARDRLASARADLEACFEPIVCTAMAPADFEGLVAKHPPREDHPEDETWNMSTFPHELFAKCAPDYLTPEEWAEWLKTRVNEGEQVGLVNTAIKANTRSMDESIPKDWTSMLS